jgi:RNA polymerase sigma-70 factor (ECF subfamily)
VHHRNGHAFPLADPPRRSDARTAESEANPETDMAGRPSPGNRPQAGQPAPKRPPRTARAGAVDGASVDALIERVRRGETALYGEIVRRYRPAVRRVAMLMLADGLVTENVVQQTFIRAYERLDDFDTGQELGQWLKAIARNLVRDELKKSSRERGRMALYRDYLLARLSAEDHGERNEVVLAEALAHCRARLPSTAARAIELRYDQELPFEEVAAALGRSPDAVRQIVTRARIALKQCIQKRLAEP